MPSKKTTHSYSSDRIKEKNSAFSTEHLVGNLKVTSVKSIGSTSLAQLIKLIFHIITIVVLGRLLSPSDFGLMAMAMVLIGLGTQLVESGLPIATIQRESVSHSEVSNVFWIGVAGAIVLCALSIAISPLFAKLYDEPQLIAIISVMSLNLLIVSLSAQHGAILRRQMRFGDVAKSEAVSIAFGVSAGVMVALYSASYWALVVSLLMVSASKGILFWCYASWRPTLGYETVSVKPFVKFGAHLSVANLFGYLTTNSMPFFIGFVGGATSLGLYNRSHTIAALPSTQLLPPLLTVMQSALTRVASDEKRFRTAALSLLRKISVLTVLVSAIMFSFSDWLIMLALGDEWRGAGEILKILSIAMIATPITTFTAAMLIALGRTEELMKWKIATLAILLISLVVGLNWGVSGLLYAFVISSVVIRMPLFLFYASRYLPVGCSDLFKVIFIPLVCGVTSSVIIGWTVAKFSFGGEVIQGWVGIVLLTWTYISLCLISTNLRTDFREVANLILDGVIKNR